MLDADGLNLLAAEPIERDDWLLTPHPGEAARLLGGATVESVQRDRLGAARALARRYRAIAVLKGPNTLVASPRCDEPIARLRSRQPRAWRPAARATFSPARSARCSCRRAISSRRARAGVLLHALAGDDAAEGRRARHRRRRPVAAFASMGESELIAELRLGASVHRRSRRRCARALRAARAWPLVRRPARGSRQRQDDLGTGDAARPRLRGRVPSPTYTLLEQYACGGLSLVHLDLYRLRGEDELENLGLRDWLAEPERWIAVEWPERAPQLAERCDLTLEFAVMAPRRPARGGRRPRTRLGIEALRSLRQGAFNNGT